MIQTITCPNCRHEMTSSPEFSGQLAACPNCSQQFTIPHSRILSRPIILNPYEPPVQAELVDDPKPKRQRQRPPYVHFMFATLMFLMGIPSLLSVLAGGPFPEGQRLIAAVLPMVLVFFGCLACITIGRWLVNGVWFNQEQSRVGSVGLVIVLVVAAAFIGWLLLFGT